MTKYDKIYIPEKCKSNEMHMAIVGDSKSLTEATNVIVLTLEELRQLWNHCAICQVDKETDYANTINFNAYLQSKGITL
jgi:hypothetical protein